MTVYELVAICKQAEEAGFADIHMDLVLVDASNPVQEIAELTGNWSLIVRGEDIKLVFETTAPSANR